MTRAPRRTKAQEEAHLRALEAGGERARRFAQATQGTGKPMTYGTGKTPAEQKAAKKK